MAETRRTIEQHTSANEDLACEACALHIVAKLEEALSGQEYATLALSGGKTPEKLYAQLARSRFPWDKVHLFWVDERAVPPSNAQSNYKLAEERFITPASIAPKNVHRIYGELAPDQAAKRYAGEIREFFSLGDGEMPHFDVVHCGIGEDCHTASLFPGEPLIEDREGIAAAVYAAKLKTWRITLLPGPLTAARQAVVLVAGAQKAEAVRAVVREPYDPLEYPAQLISHRGHGVAFFMDEAAASLLD